MILPSQSHYITRVQPINIHPNRKCRLRSASSIPHPSSNRPAIPFEENHAYPFLRTETLKPRFDHTPVHRSTLISRNFRKGDYYITVHPKASVSFKRWSVAEVGNLETGCIMLIPSSLQYTALHLDSDVRGFVVDSEVGHVV